MQKVQTYHSMSGTGQTVLNIDKTCSGLAQHLSLAIKACRRTSHWLTKQNVDLAAIQRSQVVRTCLRTASPLRTHRLPGLGRLHTWQGTGHEQWVCHQGNKLTRGACSTGPWEALFVSSCFQSWCGLSQLRMPSCCKSGHRQYIRAHQFA